jgi:hypothetical protein
LIECCDAAAKVFQRTQPAENQGVKKTARDKTRAVLFSVQPA